MAGVCCCLGDPIEGDPRPSGPQFRTTMCDAPCHDPCCCLGAMVCIPCAQFYIRRKALDYDMSRYSCCQGYYPICCFGQPNSCGAKDCPDFCLCLESLFCHSCAVSATRNYVMDQRGFQSDPCDRRLIRLNNCLQSLACICTIIACFVPACRDAAICIDRVADCVYCMTMGCMTAQVNYQLNCEKAEGAKMGQAPPQQTMM